MTKSNQIKSNQVKSSQIKSSQIKSNQTPSFHDVGVLVTTLLTVVPLIDKINNEI
jgi:hypothetical protein